VSGGDWREYREPVAKKCIGALGATHPYTSKKKDFKKLKN
jgi:hypothetical protein